MSGRASVLAPAKVNLVLRVLGRRGDGYHEIDTLFQAIDFGDDVEVEASGRGMSLEVTGDADLGPPDDNLAYRAATSFLEAEGALAGVRVRLAKRIPVGAGLGGGSSDAAAVLRCLSVLVGGVDADKMRTIGASLGSDVPFFLGASPLARGKGRGEMLQALTPLPPADLVLVSPPVHVSTAEAYRGLAPRGAGESRPAPEPCLRSWTDLEGVATNDLEPVIAAAHPEVGRALEALRDAGASPALMTGSGSTCFGLFADREAAERAATALQDATRWPCAAVRTVGAFPEVALT